MSPKSMVLEARFRIEGAKIHWQKNAGVNKFERDIRKSIPTFTARKKMKRLAMLIGVLMALPKLGAAANSWIYDKSVKEVSYQSWSGHYYVEVSLTDNTVYRFTYNPSDAASITNANGMYSNLLAAVAMGKKLSMYVTADAVVGSTPGTFGGISVSAL